MTVANQEAIEKSLGLFLVSSAQSTVPQLTNV